jgi:hypothetical protein
MAPPDAVKPATACGSEPAPGIEQLGGRLKEAHSNNPANPQHRGKLKFRPLAEIFKDDDTAVSAKGAG